MKVHTVPGMGLDSNIYIIEDVKSYIVDTGTGIYTQPVISLVEKLGLTKKMAGIVLTHRHADHSGGAYALSKAFGCRLFSSPAEAEALATGNDPSTCAFMAGIDLPKLIVKDIGNELDCGNSKFRVLSCPGHTEGHIVLFEPDTGSLICGDVVFCYGGVGRWDLPTGDYKKLLKSVQGLAKLDVKSIYPGHGPSSEGDGNNHLRMALSSLSGWDGLA